MKEILTLTHDSKTSLLKYNDENSLSCVIEFAYMYAIDHYIVRREEQLAVGFADVTFEPRDHTKKPLEQIKQRSYARQMLDRYKDRDGIIIVAICYNKKDNNKEHNCEVELFN